MFLEPTGVHAEEPISLGDGPQALDTSIPRQSSDPLGRYLAPLGSQYCTQCCNTRACKHEVSRARRSVMHVVLGQDDDARVTRRITRHELSCESRSDVGLVVGIASARSCQASSVTIRDTYRGRRRRTTPKSTRARRREVSYRTSRRT